MNCQEIQDKLYDYLFDLVEGDELKEIEAHLTTCEVCGQAHRAALRERGLLKQWTAPSPPEGLADKALAAARAASPETEGSKTPYKPVEPDLPWLGSKRFWQVLAAACFLIVVGVGVQTARVATRHARPQEAFLYGPADLTPGLPAAYRAFVRDGRTSEPIPGARVEFRLVSDTGKTIWRLAAQADDDGIVQIEPDVPEDATEGNYKLELVARSQAGESSITRDVSVKRTFRVMITTDKPLYQPGQVIHIRTLSLATADLRPVSGREVVIEVKDAKGNKVFKKIGKTSDFGISSGDFELADQVNTGSYSVVATVGDTTTERAVKVERYRLPKFKIELEVDKGFYRPGEMVKGHLSAQYTFGEPVVGGRVSIVASEFVEKFHPFATLDGETDPEGRFAFEVPLKDHFVGQELRKGDAFASLEATVTDRADHVQKKGLDLTVTTEPIRIELFPESGTLVQGVENILYIVTAYPDGRPAKTKLTIGALKSQTETSEVGIAKVKLTPSERELKLTVSAEDRTGLRATVVRQLRIDQRIDSFLLRTDRAVYTAGDTASVTVLSPSGRERIFLDVIKARRTVLQKAVVVENGRGSLEFDLPPDLFGTLELHAYRIMRDGNIVSDAKVIQVNRADDLVIQAELDKDTYRPAEKAVLKLAVQRSSGDPVQAALGLAGVDEAVFALQEMRPGLARIYFTLQEEVLKPRYEIHAHAPISFQETVAPKAEPTPEVREASVVLFSSAEGTKPPAPKPSATYAEKQVQFEQEKTQYFRSLAAVGAAVPFGLFVLSLLPILAYAVMKLFRRAPLSEVSEEHRGEFRRYTRGLILWWILGLYLPPVSGIVSVVDRFWRFRREEAVIGLLIAQIVAVLVCGVLVLHALRAKQRRSGRARQSGAKVSWLLPVGYLLVLIAPLVVLELLPVSLAAATALSRSWGSGALGVMAFLLVASLAFTMLLLHTIRVRRCEATKALPLLRKALWWTPMAYLLMVVGTMLVFDVVEHERRVLGKGAGLDLVLAAGLLACVAVGAMSIARNCALRSVTVWRWSWLGISRPVAALAPVILVGMMLPTLSRAKFAASSEQLAGNAAAFENSGRGVPMAPGLGEAGEEDSETWKMSFGTPKPQALKSPSRIRRYFPETLLWLPELITDESGRAELEVPLADSITTWRLTMNAVSGRGELGSGTKGIRVFQDFFVDIDFPVALTQHDQVSVPVAVYNYLETPQTVRLEVQPDSWFRMLGEASQTLQIGPKQVTSVYFPLEAQTPGHHSLTVKAYGSEMADAVERKVTVRPDGKEFVQTINGRLGENLSRKIVIPEDAIDGSLDLLIKIYPGSFSQVVEGLDSIFRMPYGCFEQTSSTTYPNVLVLNYLRETGQAKPEIEMKALNYINLGYQRLLSFEVDGGGFDWYGRAPAHTILTAYGLMEFSDMAKVYDVDPAVIDRTREWLCSQQQNNGSWDPGRSAVLRGGNGDADTVLRTTAYIAWALADSGGVDRHLKNAVEYVDRNVSNVSDPYTLALCVNALIASDHLAGRKAMERLVSMKQTEGELIHWTSSSEGVTYSRGNVLDIETTAIAAYALIKGQLHTEVAHKALAWLIEQKDSQGTWHSTQATVHAMRALLAGSGPSGSVDGDTHVTVAANGQLAKEITITPQTSDVFRLISLRPFVRAGENAVVLETSGQGNLAYQIVATHYLPWPKEQADPPKEIAIDVRYDTTTLKKDDLLTCEVHVRYNRPGTAQMTIVDLGIPPGFQVVPDAFEDLKNRQVIERYSMTGRQIILYFRAIPSGKPVSFKYQLRAKFPVKAKAPRSVVYQYYEPELRDESPPVELTVL